MRIEDVHSIMQNLSCKRLAFCSEADYQFSLAREIDCYYKSRNIPAQIYLEWPINIGGSGPKQRYYLDILVVINNRAYPLELKYSPSQGQIMDHCGILIDMRNRFAYDIVRYLYLKDIDRISTIKVSCTAGFGKDVVFHKGFAIILTNDKNFYGVPRNNALESLDGNFRIHDRSIPSDVVYPIPGNVVWNSPDQKHWTTKPNYSSFKIDHPISTQWNLYSSVKDFNDSKVHEFKYLVNEIV